MKKIALLISIFAGLSIGAAAQQIPIFTESQINPFLLNPAYAGNSDYANVFLHTRSLWADMPDAPQQYYLTADGALNNDKVGLGFMLHTNVEPIIRNIGALFTYRYKVRMGEHHFLSGGLSGGFLQNSLDFDKAIVENPEELAEFRGNWSKFNFDLNAGLLYQFKGLEIGVVAKQLTNTPYTYQHTTSDKSLTYRLIRHYEFSAAYTWRFSERFALRPLFVGQSTEGMPFNFMLNACVSYMDNFWIGAGYRLQSAYSIIAGLVISDRLVLGYNCDIASTDYRSQFGLTHEIAVGFRFGRQSKKATPRENVNRNSAGRLQDIVLQQGEDIDRLKQANEDLRKRLDNQATAGKQVDSRSAEQQQLLDIYTRDRAFMDSLIAVYSVDMETVTDEAMQEKQHYMVLGAYYKVADAKIFQKILEREADLETNITTSDNGRYYFVYSKIVTSRKEANAEFKRLTDMDIQKYINGNLWIYSNE